MTALRLDPDASRASNRLGGTTSSPLVAGVSTATSHVCIQRPVMASSRSEFPPLPPSSRHDLCFLPKALQVSWGPLATLDFIFLMKVYNSRSGNEMEEEEEEEGPGTGEVLSRFTRGSN
ncbi:hypothetical protein EYF80_021010 [Liparis tanakae]|uniref:Uncharacterized protein n=1 Tax=Liparis tanakae TaxID=230148 RepID=A0A4Z2HV83_9TELE|nr:hypothetical protein EYF80_021010 [Liparis tanakae]